MTTKTTVANGLSAYSAGCGPTSFGSYYHKQQAGSNATPSEWEHGLKPHPYSASIVSEFRPLIGYQFKNWSRGTTYTCTIPALVGGYSPTTPIPSLSSIDELKALNKLTSRLRQHDFNAAVALGEARESLRTIGGTAMSFARSFSLLKRGRVAEAVSTITGRKPTGKELKRFDPRVQKNGLAHSEVAGQNWLALQYGWLPLVGDSYEAAKSLAVHLEGQSKQVARYRKQLGRSELQAAWMRGCGSMSRSCSWIMYVNQAKSDTSLLAEFGFKDPELVAWELVPFSFVVDWFIPIGTWLETRAALHRLDGTLVKTIFTIEKGKMGYDPTGEIMIMYGNHSRTAISVERTVTSLSHVNVPMPRFKNPISVRHALSGISLLQQVFLGGKLVR